MNSLPLKSAKPQMEMAYYGANTLSAVFCILQKLTDKVVICHIKEAGVPIFLRVLWNCRLMPANPTGEDTNS
jgi:hypothetical protein